MRREHVTIGHKQIGYLIAEPSTAATRQRPPGTVVFLHAFPLQAVMWEPTLGAVPDGWRAVAPDLRGFGGTPLQEGGRYGMSELAGDVVDLLDHLRITQAAVVGCSMGGYVLFEMLRSAPRYIVAAGLVSTRPGADSEEGRSARQKMIAQVERDGVAAIATEMPAKLVGATTRKERPDVIAQVRNLIEVNTGHGIKAALAAMMERADSTPLLGKVAVPTLILAGAEDTLIPPAEAEVMHRAIPNAECELIPSAGHLPNIEQPGPFDARLWRFLQKL